MDKSLNNKLPSAQLGNVASAVPASPVNGAIAIAHRSLEEVPSLMARPAQLFEPSLPFADEDISSSRTTLFKPAAPMLKTSALKDLCVQLPGNQPFLDKVLPPIQSQFTVNQDYPPEYFSALHQLVNSAGTHYPQGTPNHLGARVPLQHTGLNLDMWRKHLVGYDCVEICQYIEFGFPLGLQQDPEPELKPSYRNHGSSYQFFKWIDEFIASGLENCDLSGPMKSSPFIEFNTSPLMTAVKKPDSRRAVFDASYGDSSLNMNTPSDHYLGMPIEYAYPKIEDFKRFIIKLGRGC